MVKRLGAASIVGAVLSLVAILSIFLPWATGTFFDVTDGSITGIDIFGDYYENFSYWMFPLLVTILGFISLVTFTAAPKGNVTILALFLIGIAIIACTYVTFWKFEDFTDSLNLEMAYGMYVAFIAGAGIAVTGVVARN